MLLQLHVTKRLYFLELSVSNSLSCREGGSISAGELVVIFAWTFAILLFGSGHSVGHSMCLIVVCCAVVGERIEALLIYLSINE
jgi:hypothetical protein